MKKLFTLLVMFCALGIANAQFSEDFSSTPYTSQWMVVDQDGDGHNWELMSGLQGGPDSIVLSSESYSNEEYVALTPDNWAITPHLSLQEGAVLTFGVVGQDASYASEVYAVFISEDACPTDLTKYVALTTDQTATGAYTMQTIDLASYAGKEVFIAFRHYNVTDMFRLNIDDISVTNCSVIETVPCDPTDPTDPTDPEGVAENEASFGIYPNPANDVLNVKANDVKNIEILNMLGQTVITTNVNAINVANLTNGVYFVRVNFNNGEVSTQKFVKE